MAWVILENKKKFIVISLLLPAVSTIDWIVCCVICFLDVRFELLLMFSLMFLLMFMYSCGYILNVLTVLQITLSLY